MKNIFTTTISLLGLLVLCNSITANAQSDIVNVDPSTGDAVVTIPLHTLNYGSLQVPINLVHQSNALAVAEGEGDAGLGWNLSSNYGVFRQVRGLPDEVSVGTTKLGWLSTASTIQSFTVSSNDNLGFADWSDESADFTALSGFAGVKDTEPDIYTIVGPNLYARFVYDGSGAVRLLEYQDIEITPLSNANGFTVKNNLGHVYLFNVKESITRKAKSYEGAVVDMFATEYDYYKDDSVPQFPGTWYLASVTDENGLVISFNYNSRKAIKSTRFKTRIKTATNSPDTLFTVTDEYSPQRISSISAGNKKIDFFWTSRLLLSNLKISESGLSDAFQYGFSYTNAIASYGTGSPQMHYFLITIDLYSPVTCNTEVPYRFSYKEVGNTIAYTFKQVDFSWQKLYEQDMWGYYNGIKKTGSDAYLNLVPQMNFYSAQNDGRRFTFHTISGQTPTSTLTGVKRVTDVTKIDIGTLIRVTYPTGGYTKIDYERNTYLDSLAGQVLHGPGLRVKTVTTSGGDAAYNRNATIGKSYHDIVKSYFYQKSEADTTTSGVIFYPPSYAVATGLQLIRVLDNMAPESRIAYRRVKEYTSGFGSRVYIYSFPARYPFITNSSDWTATKTKIARNSVTHTNLNADVKVGYYTFPFAPNPNYSFSQGLLTSVTEFSETGVMMREKKTTYTRISPSLASVYGVRFEKFADCDCYHFSKYQIITGVTDVITKEVVRTGDDQTTPVYSTTTNNFYYNNTAGNYLMNSIENVMGDGSVSRKYLKYVKDFGAITTPTTNDVMANAIKLMNTARRHGEVVEMYTTFTPSGGSTSVTNATLKLFKDFGSSKVYPWQTYSFPQGSSFTPASVVTGATQGFASDSDYFLSSSADDYDAQANPATISDDDKNIVGLHYAQNYTLPPVARFNKATAKQTVYEGFEIPTARSLTATNALTYTTGWTGERAAILASTNSLYNNTVDNNGKPYRVTCYVKAAQNTDITVSFVNPSTGLPLYTKVLEYRPSTFNTWVYLEGILPVTSGAVAQVKLTVTSTASVNIDDIIVMPQQAIVNTKTFLPLKGETSDTDDRGYSNTMTYDVRGRKVAVSDRQRNLVELNEYVSKGVITRFITSGFSVSDLVQGTPFTATASPYNCFGTPVYEWKLDNVVIGTNSSTLTSTINKPGPHTLSLTVSNPSNGGSSTTTEDVCVLTSGKPFSFTNDLIDGNKVCNIQASPGHFVVTPLAYCNGLPVTTLVTWSVRINNTGPYTYAGTGLTFSKSGYSPGVIPITEMDIRVVVKQTCQGGQDAKCNDATIATESDEIHVFVEDCTQ